MRSLKSCCGAALLLAVVLSPAWNTGCTVHAYRVYDPYHGDYHVWNDGEAVYYNRWAAENHHEHMEFRRLKKDDQKRYWEWRHNQH